MAKFATSGLSLPDLFCRHSLSCFTDGAVIELSPEHPVMLMQNQCLVTHTNIGDEDDSGGTGQHFFSVHP
jgi:hypothetical protein